MKRELFSLLALVICVIAVNAQEVQTDQNSFGFKFYGRIRADLFYNSRANNETVDGLFYMYPKDHQYDADGNDLNAEAQGNMYMLYTRLGVDIKGPNIGTAKTTAKIEADFRGSGTTYAVPRIRHAYVNLAWQHSQVLVGQTWHPLFGEVSPSMLNLSTGAPFQPFNRSPQIRYKYIHNKGLQLTAAAVWQQQYCSAGPEGKTYNYLKNGCIPELYAAIDYKGKGWQAGVGAEMLSLRPRKQATIDDRIYKINERVTSLSVEAHAKYSGTNWNVSAKTVLANNLTQCSMLGGFAVTSIDQQTGECDYTPFRHSMSWVNFTYGKKWQPGIFIGYLKNLGTSKPIVGQQYGVGLDVDQLLTTNIQLSYNLPHWKLGMEFTPSTAWYGKTDTADGRVVDTHSVTNYRILGVMMYTF